MADPASRNEKPFNGDVLANEGYLYTTNASLSSRLANQRLTEAVVAAVPMAGRRVLDVGCGDGAYTIELFDRCGPAAMTGVDLAAEAIGVAKRRAGGRALDFAVCPADRLPFADGAYDIAHLRGVLHHLENPAEVLREALRVAPLVVVVEPNGYNPVLKVIEKLSPYHRAHGEKSYAPRLLRGWLAGLGAEVLYSGYAGLVPFFCPDAVARALKAVEPFFERTPVLNSLCCAVQVVVARRG